MAGRKTKKTERKSALFVDAGGGLLFEILREDGKYYYSADSQFRKGAFAVTEKARQSEVGTVSEDADL